MPWRSWPARPIPPAAKSDADVRFFEPQGCLPCTSPAQRVAVPNPPPDQESTMPRASDERAMPFAGAAALSVFVVAMGLVIALAMGLSGCAERPDDGAAGGADW